MKKVRSTKLMLNDEIVIGGKVCRVINIRENPIGNPVLTIMIKNIKIPRKHRTRKQMRAQMMARQRSQMILHMSKDIFVKVLNR